VRLNAKLTVALTFIAIFHAAILFAGFLAPYGFTQQDRELPFAPPTGLHFVEASGKWHARPFVYGFAYDSDNPSAYRVDTSAIYPLHFFAQGVPYKIAGVFSAHTHLFGVDEPGRVCIMGTDSLGRDQFARFLFGGQLSLLAGILAAALSLFLGVVIGGIAGLYGGWLDELLMRGAEIFLALPWLYLLFGVRAALPLHVSQAQVFLLLVAVVGLIGWARPARLVRGVVLSAKERNFVLAARGFGATRAYILRRHVLPEAYGVLLTQMALLIPQYILAEVTLTFLGLGVGEPMASWGTLLSSLQQYYVLSSFWWMFLPALLLIPLFLAYNATADAIQERLKSVAL
jgi:peptide/nickel transport system permease protein